MARFARLARCALDWARAPAIPRAMPYGGATCAIESFPFEEIPGLPEHSNFLWANPAFACAWLLGRAFNEYGWRFRPGVVRQIGGCPTIATKPKEKCGPNLARKFC